MNRLEIARDDVKPRTQQGIGTAEPDVPQADDHPIGLALSHFARVSFRPGHLLEGRLLALDVTASHFAQLCGTLDVVA